MLKYKYVADWEGTHGEGEIEEGTLWPEVKALFHSFGLGPSEVSIVTREGIRITWTRIGDVIYSCPIDECKFEGSADDIRKHMKVHYPSNS